MSFHLLFVQQSKAVSNKAHIRNRPIPNLFFLISLYQFLALSSAATLQLRHRCQEMTLLEEGRDLQSPGVCSQQVSCAAERRKKHKWVIGGVT